MTRIIACVLLSAACGLATGAEDAPKIELKMLEPAVDAKARKGVELYVRVRISVPDRIEPPRRVDADFARVAGGAHAGQFTGGPVKLTRHPDGSYVGSVKVKTPTSSAEHTLKVVAHGKPAGRPAVASTTLNLREAADEVRAFSGPAGKRGGKE